MKFFKHFTDAHRGKSLQQLLNSKNKEIGFKAIGIYWTIVELCAEKMTKSRNEEFTDADCNFEFNLKYLRDTLSLHQSSTLAMYLRWYGDVGLMSSRCTDDVVSIYMPKLLECLDRDSKRARPERGSCAPKIKKKIKKKIKNTIRPSDDEALLISGEGEQELSEPTPTDLVELWNEMKHEDLPAVIAIPPRRLVAAKARLKENPSAQFWCEVIERINNSKFCLGKIKTQDRAKPWKADFDWMIKPDTATKILEGKYDNK